MVAWTGMVWDHTALREVPQAQVNPVKYPSVWVTPKAKKLRLCYGTRGETAKKQAKIHWKQTQVGPKQECIAWPSSRAKRQDGGSRESGVDQTDRY